MQSYWRFKTTVEAVLKLRVSFPRCSCCYNSWRGCSRCAGSGTGGGYDSCGRDHCQMEVKAVLQTKVTDLRSTSFFCV